MRIAICDDNKEIRDSLTEYFARLGLPVEIAEFDCGEKLLESATTFDIYLMDVQMQELTGIDTARQLRDRGCDSIIIFITNYIQYAIDGYEVQAYHFLKKPIDEKRFRKVLTAAIDLAGKRRQNTVTIKSASQQVKLAVNDIVYCETARGNIYIHTKSGETMVSNHTMAQMEQILDGQDFFRCHTAYLINMAHIDRLDQTDVIMTGNIVLPVSKHRKKEMKQILSFYWSGNIR